MSDTIKHKWWDFHKANPQVYELFERFTNEAINAKVDTRLSAW